MPEADLILVTGATGNTGARVLSGLRDNGYRARAASRNIADDDRDAVVFDWRDRSTFAPALAGVRAVYVVAPVGVAAPVPLVEPFLEQAVDAGARRVVQLSSSAVDRGDAGLGELHDLIADMFAEYTILRPSWFMQNFVGNHPVAEGIRRSGEIITATCDGRLGFIDAADIAAVASQALIAAEPVGAEVVLTGPESLSYADAAAILSDLLDRPIRHVDLPTDRFAAHLTAAGFSTEFAAGLAALDEQIRSGAQDLVTSAVRDISGREPISLRRFLADHL